MQPDVHMNAAALPYKRVLVKLSGEALMGEGDYGIDPAVIKRIALELQELIAMGVHVALSTFAPNVSVPDTLLGLSWDQVHLALGFQAALMMLAFLIRAKCPLEFGIGFWFMLLAAIALLVGAIMRVNEAGSGPRAAG